MPDRDYVTDLTSLERELMDVSGAFGSPLLLKILDVEHLPRQINDYSVGELFLHNNKLGVQCGQDALIIKKLQLAGKRITNAEEFIRGHKNYFGLILK